MIGLLKIRFLLPPLPPLSMVVLTRMRIKNLLLVYLLERDGVVRELRWWILFSRIRITIINILKVPTPLVILDWT